MASIAISSANPFSAPQPAVTSKAAPEQAEPEAKAPPRRQPDTVKLSAAAQAEMMYRAGQSPALIAATLGTNIVAVDGYLYIKVAAQASATPTATLSEGKEVAATAAQRAATAPEAAPEAEAKAPVVAAKS